MATSRAQQPFASLSDGTPLESFVDSRSGRVSRRIYSDPELYQLEQEHIFRRSWCYLAHESEIAEPGNFVTRLLANEPVVLIRDDEGAVRAFLNSCRHRGMRLCRTDSGSTSYLRCPYHGWAYTKTGALQGVFAEDFYSEETLDKADLGLIPVTQLAVHKGLIFGTWADDAEPFEEFLGDMAFYLDLLVGRTPLGTEVIGTPQVWESHSNWKLLAENSCDNQHLHTAHGSVVQLGLLPPDPMALAAGNLIHAGNGHILHVVPGPPIPMFQYYGLPEDLRRHMAECLTAEQMQVAKSTTFSVGNIFPNLSFLQVMIQGDPNTPPTAFLNMRVWQPLGPDRTRIMSFVLIEKEATPEHRRASLETYVRTFGPSGIFEQDDMENLEECTRINAGKIAQRHPLHHAMGLHMPPIDTFPGPGTVWPASFGESAQLAFYQSWQDRLVAGETK